LGASARRRAAQPPQDGIGEALTSEGREPLSFGRLGLDLLFENRRQHKSGGAAILEPPKISDISRKW
jgi:hypothetical protein